MILLQTSPCDQSDCQNGAQCLVVAGEPICRCMPGFYGNKCDKMSTVHFLGRDGYVELPGAKLRPTAHISLQVWVTFDFCSQSFGFQGVLTISHHAGIGINFKNVLNILLSLRLKSATLYGMSTIQSTKAILCCATWKTFLGCLK